MKPTLKDCQTYICEIHIAGDKTKWTNQFLINTVQEYCNNIGMCVSITEQAYVYTQNDRESSPEYGWMLRFINYPRFPDDEENIFSKCVKLANILITALAQDSCSIVCYGSTKPKYNKTVWISYRDS